MNRTARPTRPRYLPAPCRRLAGGHASCRTCDRARHLDVQRCQRERNRFSVAKLMTERAGALLVGNDSLFVRREQIVALAARYAVPAMFFLREFATAGGLVSKPVTSLHERLTSRARDARART